MSALDLDGLQADIWNLRHLLEVLRDRMMEKHHDDRAEALMQIARDMSQTICCDIDAAVDSLAKAQRSES